MHPVTGRQWWSQPACSGSKSAAHVASAGSRNHKLSRRSFFFLVVWIQLEWMTYAARLLVREWYPYQILPFCAGAAGEGSGTSQGRAMRRECMGAGNCDSLKRVCRRREATGTFRWRIDRTTRM